MSGEGGGLALGVLGGRGFSGVGGGEGADFFFSTGGVVSAGFAWDESGITNTSRQAGHFPFLPMALAGVLTVCEQAGQGNSMNSGDGIACSVAGASGFRHLVVGCLGSGSSAIGSIAAGTFAADSLAAGMATIALQCGHFPFFPAAEAGVDTSFPHE